MTTIVIEKNIMVPMRDGVRLATDIIRLARADPMPVLLMRNPYGKEISLTDGAGIFDIGRAVEPRELHWQFPRARVRDGSKRTCD